MKALEQCCNLLYCWKFTISISVIRITVITSILLCNKWTISQDLIVARMHRFPISTSARQCTWIGLRSWLRWRVDNHVYILRRFVRGLLFHLFFCFRNTDVLTRLKIKVGSEQLVRVKCLTGHRGVTKFPRIIALCAYFYFCSQGGRLIEGGRLLERRGGGGGG